MGNSEVGHLNIGAGRIVYQTLTRIDLAIEDGAFMANPALLAGAMREAKARGATLHLLGLIGPGGVHAQDMHLLALLRLAKAEGLTKVAIHAFLDGRDTPPESARGYMQHLEAGIRADRRRPGRDGLRALLRDGSRQALGSRPEGVRRADARRGRTGAVARTRRLPAPTRRASPMSSSCPR